MRSEKRNVEVSSESFVSMAVHAGQNATTVVHGILMGHFDQKITKIIKAIPVCHETPTKPLLQTALALASSADQGMVVVGWYIAPEKLDDKNPGPVPLRIVSNITTDEYEPVLILLDNDALVACLTGEAQKENVVKGFVKDFGQQWLEPVTLRISDEAKAVEVARSAFSDGIQVVDLTDHFEDSTRDW
eukprot:CAMPEP_0194146078 /NCGR_PEP_ID=MMETSP0152-20130528/19524_1 /TAXON_ID=1049557 /ORGANISM="Thalassiothrix antarctica, Strain L6-D1" /LENGTH=187 /DNA_ID=CAMNT_0038846495 /DNA_START=13 /DNA_END=573 /DNA_ORIENTATION=+